MPKPSPLPRPSTADSSPDFFHYLLDKIMPKLEVAFSFAIENVLWLLIIGVLLGGLYYVLYKLHKQKTYIKKLWLFTLFFLTKRQMMIPLVYALAKRDNYTKYKNIDKLLVIREKCKHISLKISPTARLRVEKEISEFLFDYFTVLEQRGVIAKKSKFEYIVKDLEYIDKKLVDLQKLYNHETTRWNKIISIPVLKYFFRIFSLRTFEKFAVIKDQNK